MVLVLDTDTSTTSSDISPTMKRGSGKGKRCKSLGHAPPKRSLSLLVDYSKRKANVSSSSSSKELFGSVTLPDSLRNKTPAETIDHALNLVTSLSDDTAAQLDDSTTSFALDDIDTRPVSFRVRRTSIRRSKSMDDRVKMSSYDHLQNSIRSALLFKDDDEENDDKSQDQPQAEEDVPPNRRASMGTTTTTTSKPSVDRRSQLANLRKKHQSMRNMSTKNLTATSSHGKRPTRQRSLTTQQSLRNLNSATAACAPSSTAPQHHSPPPVPRRTRDREGLNSKSMHQNGGRRASMVAAANSKCKSCRNLIQRSKSLQENNATLNASVSLLNGGSLYGGGSSHIPKGSLHGASDHSTASSQVSFASTSSPTKASSRRPHAPKRIHTTGGMGGGRRGSTLAMMKAQTMSRRNLLQGALAMPMPMDDESSKQGGMDESAIFFTGSRIRRLDGNQQL